MSVRLTLQYIFSKDVGNYIMTFTHDDYFTIKICGYARSIFRDFDTHSIFKMDKDEYRQGSKNNFRVYYFEANADRKITQALNCDYHTFWSSYILTDEYLKITDRFLRDNSTLTNLEEELNLIFTKLDTQVYGNRPQARHFGKQQYSEWGKPKITKLETFGHFGHYIMNKRRKEPIDYMDISTKDWIGSYHDTVICYYDNGVYQKIPIDLEDPFLRNIFAIANVNY